MVAEYNKNRKTAYSERSQLYNPDTLVGEMMHNLDLSGAPVEKPEDITGMERHTIKRVARLRRELKCKHWHRDPELMGYISDGADWSIIHQYITDLVRYCNRCKRRGVDKRRNKCNN